MRVRSGVEYALEGWWALMVLDKHRHAHVLFQQFFFGATVARGVLMQYPVCPTWQSAPEGAKQHPSPASPCPQVRERR